MNESLLTESLKKSFLTSRNTRINTLSGYYFNLIDLDSDVIRSTLIFKCRSNFVTQGYVYHKENDNYFYYDILSNLATKKSKVELSDAQLNLHDSGFATKNLSFSFQANDRIELNYFGKKYVFTEITPETQDAHWFFAGFTNIGMRQKNIQMLVSQLRYLSPLVPYRWGRVALGNGSILKIFNYGLKSGVEINGNTLQLESITKFEDHIIVKSALGEKFVNIWLRFANEVKHTFTTHGFLQYTYGRYDVGVDKIETNIANIDPHTSGKGVFEITSGTII